MVKLKLLTQHVRAFTMLPCPSFQPDLDWDVVSHMAPSSPVQPGISLSFEYLAVLLQMPSPVSGINFCLFSHL